MQGPAFLLLFLVLAIPRPSLAQEAPGSRLTLQEAFHKALVRSESLAIEEQNIRIAEAHYTQTLGTVLPHLDAKATEFIQDTNNSGDASVGGTFTRRTRPEVAISLTQPLFQGFREFRALGVSKAEKRQNSFRRDRARQILFADVTRAYYMVLETEHEFEILESIQKTFGNRIHDLNHRIELGKSRESERLTTESQEAAIEAEVERARGVAAISRDYLGFLVGETVTAPLEDQFQVPPSIAPLETYLASLHQRPDLKAASESLRLAQGELHYEKGGRYPTLDFKANYYPYRVGFLSDIDWDMTFSLNFPIFQGGATRGKIREASAQLKQSELEKEESTRRAELEIRQAYHTLEAAKAREEALRRADVKASANYKAQLEEYRLGLVNNLDVLQGLRDWEDRSLDANQGHYQTKLEYLNLLTAIGDLPPKEMQ